LSHSFHRHRALIQRPDHLRGHDVRALSAALRGTLSKDLAELSSGLGSLREQAGEGSGSSRLAELESLALRAQQDLRSLLHSLDPPGPADLGLLPALERCVADFKDTTGATANVQFTSRLPALTDAKQALLHAALVEALHNVRSHARARHVDVWLAADPGIVQLKVCDDGIGMTASDCRKPGVLGLFGLHERLASVGGALRMTGTEGEGTLFDVELPVAQGLRQDASAWNHVPYVFVELARGSPGLAQGG
jgi:signal transduction histidine kinase